MVIENASEIGGFILENLPAIITEKFGFLITILKAIGIAFLIYLAYLIFKGILSWKDRLRLKRVEEKIDLINNKLDKILKKGKRK